MMISMKIEAIIIYIVIPIVAAAIGGTITLFGVKATIKNQEKGEKKKRINSIRPWIYFSDGINGMVDTSIALFPDNYAEEVDSAKVGMFIINTDNGIALLDRIESETCIYKPKGLNLIDKSSKIAVYLYSKNRVETLRGFMLFIKDVDGNEYRYPVKMSFYD